MASRSEQDGPATQLASQASRQIGSAAHWLSEREPDSLVVELKGFARNKPGTFLCIAAGIGLFAGRMTRGAKAGPPDSSQGSDRRGYDSRGYDSPGYDTQGYGTQSYPAATPPLETPYPATQHMTTPTRAGDGEGEDLGLGQGTEAPYPAPGSEIYGEDPAMEQPFTPRQGGQTGMNP
jgi:hypothetical protein